MAKFDSLLSLSSGIARGAIPTPQSSKHFLPGGLTVLPAGFPHGTPVPGAAWVFLSHCFHHSVSCIPQPPSSGMWILTGFSISSPALQAYSHYPEHREFSVSPPASKMMFWARTSFLFEAAVLSQFTLSHENNRNKNPFALGGFEPECL